MRAFILVFTFVLLLGGCVLEQEDTLDYRNDISDYDVKKIVKEVLSSQNSINNAGIITADGLQDIQRNNRSRDLFSDQYRCENDGYATIRLSDNDFSLTFNAGDIFGIDYHDCVLAQDYYQDTRIDGTILIDMHQNMQDYQNILLDFGVSYIHTYFYTALGQIYIDGDVGVHYDYHPYDDGLNITLQSSHLTIENQKFFEKDIFDNVVLDFFMDTYSGKYHYHYSGTMDNRYFGRLSFSTVETLYGFDDKNPYSGQFKITNDHISLLVEPLDDYYVDIVVQNHYASQYNHVIHTTWINIGL